MSVGFGGTAGGQRPRPSGESKNSSQNASREVVSGPASGRYDVPDFDASTATGPGSTAATKGKQPLRRTKSLPVHAGMSKAAVLRALSAQMGPLPEFVQDRDSPEGRLLETQEMLQDLHAATSVLSQYTASERQYRSLPEVKMNQQLADAINERSAYSFLDILLDETYNNHNMHSFMRGFLQLRAHQRSVESSPRLEVSKQYLSELDGALAMYFVQNPALYQAAIEKIMPAIAEIIRSFIQDKNHSVQSIDSSLLCFFFNHCSEDCLALAGGSLEQFTINETALNDLDPSNPPSISEEQDISEDYSQDPDLSIITFPDGSQFACTFDRTLSSIDDFDYDKPADLLGEGGFGKVYPLHAVSAYSGMDYRLNGLRAVKIVDLSSMAKEKHRSIDSVQRSELREYVLARKLEGIDGVVVPEYVYRSDELLCFIMPLLDGYDLCKILFPSGGLNDPVPLEENELRYIMGKLLLSLAAVHARGVAHSDIKIENVFVEKDGSVKLIDFGLGTSLSSNESGETKGTFMYMSPETLKVGFTVDDPNPGVEDPTVDLFVSNRAVSDDKSDMFSLGILFQELLTGIAQFDPDDESVESDEEDAGNKVAYNRFKAHHDLRKEYIEDWYLRYSGIDELSGKRIFIDEPPYIDEDTGELVDATYYAADSWQDLFFRLTAPNPSERLSAVEALRHPWMKKGFISRKMFRDLMNL